MRTRLWGVTSECQVSLWQMILMVRPWATLLISIDLLSVSFCGRNLNGFGVKIVPPSATTRISAARKSFIRARGRDSDPPKAHRSSCHLSWWKHDARTEWPGDDARLTFERNSKIYLPWSYSPTLTALNCAEKPRSTLMWSEWKFTSMELLVDTIVGGFAVPQYFPRTGLEAEEPSRISTKS